MKNLPTAAYERRQFFGDWKYFKTVQIISGSGSEIYMYVDGQNNTVQVIFYHEDFV